MMKRGNASYEIMWAVLSAVLGILNLYAGIFVKKELDGFNVLIGAVWMLYAVIRAVRAVRAVKETQDPKTR